MKVTIDQIRILSESYPRQNLDNDTLHSYSQNIDQLPPITLSVTYALIDGYHRLTVHKMAQHTEIEVEEPLLDIPDTGVFVEAIKRNAFHGKPLTTAEKRDAACRLFQDGYANEKDIALLLGVGKSVVYEWVKDLRKTQKEEREKQIIDLYLASHTQEEIGEKLGLTHQAISKILDDAKNSIRGKSCKPDSLQYYNVWNFGQCDSRYGLKGFPGRIPGQILENLLYYYTEPFDLVVDPMGGGGTTIDVCKALYRRYLISDINPVRPEILKHDIREGFLSKAKKCKLIFLDPPYWRLKQAQYSQESASADGYGDWLDFIGKVANDAYETIATQGIVALLLEPFFDRSDLGQFLDLTFDCHQMFLKAGLCQVQRVSVPLPVSTININDQQYGQKNRILLDLNRDLLIYCKKG